MDFLLQKQEIDAQIKFAERLIQEKQLKDKKISREILIKMNQLEKQSAELKAMIAKTKKKKRELKTIEVLGPLDRL